MRTPTAKAATVLSKPTTPLSEKLKFQRQAIKVKTEVATTIQLLTPPITPVTAENTLSRRLHTMTDNVAKAVDPPQWILKMQQVQKHTLPGLLRTPNFQAKTYTEVSFIAAFSLILTRDLSQS
jgi:hypothetical protein